MNATFTVIASPTPEFRHIAVTHEGKQAILKVRRDEVLETVHIAGNVVAGFARTSCTVRLIREELVPIPQLQLRPAFALFRDPLAIARTHSV